MLCDIAKYLSFLLVAVVLFTSFTVPANSESDSDEQLYLQFRLSDGKKPRIPPYPLENTDIADTSERMIRYQEWWNARIAHMTAAAPDLDKIQSFTKKSARMLLDGKQNANSLYSPVNLWFYLELMSKLTEKNSQAQVLDAMGLSAERDSSLSGEDLFTAVYWDDSMSVCRPALSVWIDQRTHMAESLVRKLSSECHAEVFQGPMSEQVFDESLRAWLNDQTNHLLEDVVNGLGFDQTMGMSLCASLYIRCLWGVPFSREDTYTDVFYTRTGESSAEFMKKTEEGTVYYGKDFSSVIMDLQDGSYVALVLPELEKDIKDCLCSEELFEFLFTGKEWGDRRYGKINITMPGIDIFTAIPLKETLAQMGVTDIFDSEKAAFSEDITFDEGLKISSIDQYSRLIMNEDGVEGASIILSDVSAFPASSSEEIDFILNRPFLFAVFSETNVPLFIGVYRMP